MNDANSARQALNFGGLLNAVGALKGLLAGGKINPLQILSLATTLLTALQQSGTTAPASLTAPGGAEALSSGALQQLITDVMAALADGRITLREAIIIIRDLLSAAAEVMGDDAAPASAATGSSATPPAAGTSFGFPSNG